MKQWLTNLFFSFRLFSVFAVSFLAGILLASFINMNWSQSWPVFILIIFILLFSALFNFYYRNKYFTLISLGLIFLTLGMGYYSWFELKHQPKLPYGNKVEIAGTIVARPQDDGVKQKVVFEPDRDSDLAGRLLLRIPSFPTYEYGDRLEIRGTVDKPQNFDGFDYGGYLKRQLVFGIVQNPETKLWGKDCSFDRLVLRLLYRFSSSFERAINRSISEPQASLASGILLGVKRDIPADLMDDLSKTGLTHIIALSGYNVTIIIIMFSALAALWLGRRWTFWVGSLLVIIFVLMTGASSSVIRAAIFSLMILFGKTIGRQGDQTNLMLLAAVIMVLFNPFILHWDTGFQLSFLAFAGLIYLSPIIKKRFEKSRIKFLPEGIKMPLSETLSAQIFVAPILIWQFGRLSFIAPIANVFVLWTIPFSMAVIAITGFAGMIYRPLGILFGGLLWPLMEYIIKIVEIMAKVPFSSILIKS